MQRTKLSRGTDNRGHQQQASYNTLYLGYRNYALDVHLIGANAAAVPTKPINNWSAVMGGVRLRWGKIDKDDD